MRVEDLNREGSDGLLSGGYMMRREPQTTRVDHTNQTHVVETMTYPSILNKDLTVTAS